MAKPQGQLVKVDGQNMHIRQMGSGEKTIVLLPGFAVPLPTVEFAPLMRELSKKNTVCTIEFFGYGHSDGTDVPRTNENYVKEIREALTFARLIPPYVLMPYSASGVYCEYYASKYPEEIAGLILLDSTPTVEDFASTFILTNEEIDEMKSALESVKVSKEEIENDEEGVAELMRHGYTKEEIIETLIMPNHVDTLIAQWVALTENILEAMTMPISKEIPILALTSDIRELLEGNELDKHEKYLNGHIDRLGEHTKYVMIKGSTHSDIYYHRDYCKVISKEVDEFLGCAE